jgi:AraC-like DNA-binding protein
MRMAKRKQNSNKARLDEIPTAVGGMTRAAYARAIQARLDGALLLKRAGLTTRQVTNFSSRIGVRSQIKFLNLVADALEDEFLGVHLAQRVDLRELGLLYYVLASSEQLGDALQRAARYSSIQNEGVHLNFRLRKDATLSFEYVGVGRMGDRHQIEFFVTILVRICRHLTSRQLLPSSIKFLHLRAGIPPDVGAFFGCNVSFGRAADEIVFPGSIESIPIVGADPYLNSLLLKYCEEALANRSNKPNAWGARVENAIAPLLPHGQAGMAHVCRNLGVTRRTLARRLASENQTFFKVRDRLRFELARRYLKEPGLPVSKIAWLLGYRDTSAFDHAFKRWTGAPPSRTRV